VADAPGEPKLQPKYETVGRAEAARFPPVHPSNSLREGSARSNPPTSCRDEPFAVPPVPPLRAKEDEALTPSRFDAGKAMG